MKPSPLRLELCPKAFTADLDKAAAPLETIKWAQERLARMDVPIIEENRRIDNGRLGIPVYMAICASAAREILPTRKQMGKGSSPEQAQASAIMELLERYSFFSFWENPEGAARATWSEAQRLFGGDLIPVTEIIKSVNDSISPEECRKLLDCREWLFYPATRLAENRIVWLPLDWFRLLGEFNGLAAGNTKEEALLQALCELLERHACALYSATHPRLPTIDLNDCHDPVLQKLVRSFAKNRINLVLKDMGMGLPCPCVAALAWDESTFPQASEIVFTAGCATSPEKAAIRAITEVAQLAGDFCSGSCYEASGLEKFSSLGQIEPLLDGEIAPLSSLPDVSGSDIGGELLSIVKKLSPLAVYAIDLTHPQLEIPACWCIAPGLQFRERDKNQSVGLFLGRLLAESGNLPQAQKGFELIEKVYGKAHFLPFFKGLSLLYANQREKALDFFASAIAVQPDSESRALAVFYAGYVNTLLQKWSDAQPLLEEAVKLDPAMKEALNLLGVCFFKSGAYQKAEDCFDRVLQIDRGSVMDLANRGVCRKLQGKLDQAREDLHVALAMDPSLDFVQKHLEELE